MSKIPNGHVPYGDFLKLWNSLRTDEVYFILDHLETCSFCHHLVIFHSEEEEDCKICDCDYNKRMIALQEKIDKEK